MNLFSESGLQWLGHSVRQIVLYSRNHPDFLDMRIILVSFTDAELALAGLPDLAESAL
jgi:hypothetical protein